MNTMGRHGERMAQALASGSTVSAAIELTGVSRSHGYRLSRSDDVIRRVAEIRSEAASATVGALTLAATRAVEVLVSIMDSAAAKDSDRITAARAILLTLGPISELSEMRRRLDQLEQNQLRVTG